MTREEKIRNITEKVILGCHPGKSLEEALEAEKVILRGVTEIRGFPITLGRLLSATRLNYIMGGLGELSEDCCPQCGLGLPPIVSNMLCNWKPLKEDGQECTIEDQSDETIDILLNLLV